ncbi:MAG: restriction endonuclease, partial [Calditrichaeota bacterium]|nr:restriction endonuclease [Calditrichota bacterium]
VIITGLNEAFVITAEQRQRLIDKDPKSAEIIVPFVKGDDVRKWRVNYRDRYLILTKIGVEIGEYPLVYDHLKKHQEKLERRQDQGNFWWELRACDYYDEFAKPKIVWPDIAKESRFALDKNGYFYGNTVYFSPVDCYYLLGLLNSKPVWQYLLRHTAVLGDPDKGGRVRHFRQYMVTIPTSANGNKEAIMNLAERAVMLKDKITTSLGLAERRRLEAQLLEVEREIDRAVYNLYGLTEKEIAIVEGRS